MNPLQKIWDAIVYFGTHPAQLALLLLPPACLVAASVANPQGAINTFMIHAVDIIFAVWPSTPDNYKINVMLGNFFLAYPALPSGPIYEILHGVAVYLLLVVFFKMFKALPFI